MRGKGNTVDKGTYSLLGFTILAFMAIVFIRGAFHTYRLSLEKAFRLRLNAPEGDPPLHIEAPLRVINPLTFYSKRAELSAFIEGHASRNGCAGCYGHLIDAVVKAAEEYHALPASDEGSDVVLGALHISKSVEAALKKHFDEKLKPFGVRIGGLSKCALGTKPP